MTNKKNTDSPADPEPEAVEKVIDENAPKTTEEKEEKEIEYPPIFNLDELLRIDDRIYDHVHISEWKRRLDLRSLSLGEMGIVQEQEDKANQSALMLAYSWINPATKHRVIQGSVKDMLEYCTGLKAKNGSAFAKVTAKVESMHAVNRKGVKKSLS